MPGQLQGKKMWWLLLAVLWLAATLGILRGWGSMFFGHSMTDMYYQFYPWRVFMCRWFDRGVIPLWDPHVFGGTPVLEMQQRGMWYPISMLCIAILPATWSLLVEMSLHLAASLAASWYGLRRGFGVSATAAVLGASCYVFGGTMAGRVAGAHFTVVAASGLMVLALGAMYRAMSTSDARTRNRWIAVSGAVGAAMVYAGSPQYVVYTGCAQFVMLVAVFANRDKHAWRRMALVFGGAWACAALTSAPQWMPTMAYLPWSARGADAVSALMKPVSLLEWATVGLEFFTPLPLGNEVLTTHLSSKSLWETGSYPGMIGLIATMAALPLCARSGRLRRVVLSGTAVTLFGLYLCSGGFFPGMSSFREPMKARTVVVLGLTVLSAVGLDALRIVILTRRLRWRVPVVTACCTTGILIIGYIVLLTVSRNEMQGTLFGNWLLGDQPPFDPVSVADWVAAKKDPFRVMNLVAPAVSRALGFAFLGGLLIICAMRSRCRTRSTMLLSSLVILGAAEPLIAHYPLFVSRCKFSEADLPQQVKSKFEPLIRETMQNDQPMWRVSIHNMMANLTHHQDGLYELSGYDPIMPAGANNRQVIIGGGDLVKTDRYRLIDVVTAAIGQRYEASFWEPNSPEPFAPMVHMANTSASLVGIERNVVAGRLSATDFGPTTQGLNFVVPGNMARAETDATLPAEFRTQVEKIMQNKDAVAARMVNPNLAAVTSDSVRMLNPNSAPHIYETEVSLRAPALVVLRNTWLPGWRVSVDEGPEGKPWIANNWMVAVPVDEGNHRVRFIYRPQYLALSWMLGTLGAVLLFAVADGALRIPFRRRKETEDDTKNELKTKEVV